MPVLRTASQAGPMCNPRNGTSVTCSTTPSGWPNSVCSVVVVRPFWREVHIRAKGGNGRGKWRDRVL